MSTAPVVTAMRVLSRVAAQDRVKVASTTPWIMLLDIIWGGTHNRYARNTDNITFDAGDGLGPQLYEAGNFKYTASFPSQNQLPSCSIDVSNTLGVVGQLVDASGGLVDATANVYVICMDNPAGETELAMSYSVTKSSVKSAMVTLTLGAPSPLRALFPRWVYRGDFCMFVTQYKGNNCKYAGPLPYCDGSLDGSNGCQVHDNTINFGGFPGIGTGGLAVASQS